MNAGDFLKNKGKEAAKNVVNQYLASLKKKIIIGAIMTSVPLLMLIALFGAGDNENSSVDENTDGYTDVGAGGIGEIDTDGTTQQILAQLFPSGTPKTQEEMSQYLATISVPITKKDGTKTTSALTVHKSIANDVIEVFQNAQNNGFKIYQASAYNWRYMNNGGSGNLSHHSYGIAIDINVTENYSHRGSTVYAGKFWNPESSEYSIPRDGALVKAFYGKGWSWGGDWKGNYQDYMHFSLTGN